MQRTCCRWRSSGLGCSSATSSSSSLSSASSSALGLAPGTYALSRLWQRSTRVTCQLAARLPCRESGHDPHHQRRVPMQTSMLGFPHHMRDKHCSYPGICSHCQSDAMQLCQLIDIEEICY